MLIFHFCFMPFCKGKFVCLFLHYILGTQPTARNEITKTLDLSRILTGGEEGLEEKRKNQNGTNSSHSGQFMLFVVFLFCLLKQNNNKKLSYNIEYVCKFLCWTHTTPFS